MYGVVLWSDKNDKKAVIWCEDHGDLAFYSAEEQIKFADGAEQESVFDGFSLDAGDLVQFEVREDRHLRYAVRPTLIAEDHYPNLAQGLNQATAPTKSTMNTSQEVVSRKTADVIMFKNAQCSRDRHASIVPTRNSPFEL